MNRSPNSSVSESTNSLARQTEEIAVYCLLMSHGVKRVLVGMSGGVDSSVSAALLVEAGYHVEGVFLKVWSDDDAANELIECPWEADLADAQAVAKQLGIPLHIKNVQREYFARVVEVMKAGYAQGETPNPDVLCNSEVKFGILYDWAMEQGFDAVATGHYAQVVNGQLQTAADAFKDQTYFLWRVTHERFEHILFPIGHLTKPQVRAEALRLQLPNATKPDSQGICFLGKVDVRTWLARELNTVPGPVLNQSGKHVGTHAGAGLYTIGQRHGLGLPGGSDPQYVVARDIAANTLVVSDRAALDVTTIRAGQLNWHVDSSALNGELVEVRIRHQGERISGVLTLEPNGGVVLQLTKPAVGVATGQSVVLYRDTFVLAGGIIQ